MLWYPGGGTAELGDILFTAAQGFDRGNLAQDELEGGPDSSPGLLFEKVEAESDWLLLHALEALLDDGVDVVARIRVEPRITGRHTIGRGSEFLIKPLVLKAVDRVDPQEAAM